MNKLYHTCKPSCQFKMDVFRGGELYWPFSCYIILPKKKSFVYEGIGKLFERVLIIAHFVYMISPTYCFNLLLKDEIFCIKLNIKEKDQILRPKYFDFSFSLNDNLGQKNILFIFKGRFAKIFMVCGI